MVGSLRGCRSNNVFSRFGALRVLATFFMLDQLQQAMKQSYGVIRLFRALWSPATPSTAAIAELSDQAIVDCLMHDLLPMAHLLSVQPSLWITRCAVTQRRCRCSRRQLPEAAASRNFTGCVCWYSADGAREFGAKICQERAYVGGLKRPTLLRRRIVEGCAASRSWQHPVIPIREDEPQVLLGRALNKLVMDPLELFGISWPWLP